MGNLIFSGFVAFLVAMAIGFSSAMATVVVVALVIGCIVLAFAIIVGYAVKVVERDDRERGL